MKFYEIKPDMTAQHKKYLKELKTAYENSYKSLKDGEDKQLKLVTDLSKKIKDKYIELKDINSEVEHGKVELELLGVEKEALDKKIFDKHTAFNIKEIYLRNLQEQNIKDKDNFDKYIKSCNEKISEREKELDKINESAYSTLKKNREVLDKMREEREALKQREDTLIKERLDLQDRQRAFKDLRDKHEAGNSKFKAEITKIRLDKENLEKREQQLVKKQETQSKRDKEYAETNQRQKDKEIELDLKELTLNKREKRVDDLIEIHKLNVKTI